MGLEVSVNPLLDALRALAEPTRLRILAICAKAELTVSELTRILGQSQPRVSRHLKLLCDAGVLERFREQTYAYFRVARRGSGSDIAHAILALVPADEAIFLLDRRRVEEELEAREAEAAEIMRQLEADLTKARNDQPDQHQIEEAVQALLGEAELGELLEIGTGTGGMLRFLARQSNHAVGIDISPRMLRVARAQIQRAGIADHVAVRLGDMHHLEYPDQNFDTICLDRVLSFADRPAEVVAEAYRLLRAHGRLVIIEVENDLQELGMVQLRSWLDQCDFELFDQKRIIGPKLNVVIVAGQRPQRKTGVA